MQDDLFQSTIETYDSPASDLDLISVHRLIYAKLSLPFVWVFSMSLHRYWDRFYGFDIVKFDEDNFEFSETLTLADKIEQRYGRVGLSFIELLISKPANMAKWLDGPEGSRDNKTLWHDYAKGLLTFK